MTEILILGGTGKTGRRITRRLVEAGHTVRAAARTPGDPRPGVVPTRFDWDDPDTHDEALAGVDAAYLVPPALRLDYADQVGGLAARARQHGVRRLVFLSARGGNLDPDSPLARAEAALAGAGVDWSVVRPTWFAQNFTESFFRPAIEAEGVVVAPAGDGGEPFIDTEDIAAVAARLLVEDGHAGEAHDLSGPRALTFAEVTAVLSEVTGRELRYVDADPAEWQQGVEAAGVPTEYAAVLGMLMGAIRDGHDATLSTGVQDVLGREPGSFEAWAAREADVLRAAPATA